jgi:hypothetical protein
MTKTTNRKPNKNTDTDNNIIWSEYQNRYMIYITIAVINAFGSTSMNAITIPTVLALLSPRERDFHLLLRQDHS